MRILVFELAQAESAAMGDADRFVAVRRDGRCQRWRVRWRSPLRGWAACFRQRGAGGWRSSCPAGRGGGRRAYGHRHWRQRGCPAALPVAAMTAGVRHRRGRGAVRWQPGMQGIAFTHSFVHSGFPGNPQRQRPSLAPSKSPRRSVGSFLRPSPRGHDQLAQPLVAGDGSASAPAGGNPRSEFAADDHSGRWPMPGARTMPTALHSSVMASAACSVIRRQQFVRAGGAALETEVESRSSAWAGRILRTTRAA
jgi:hypothetical protein